jgi:hypothetical protein
MTKNMFKINHVLVLRIQVGRELGDDPINSYAERKLMLVSYR